MGKNDMKIRFRRVKIILYSSSPLCFEHIYIFLLVKVFLCAFFHEESARVGKVRKRCCRAFEITCVKILTGKVLSEHFSLNNHLLNFHHNALHNQGKANKRALNQCPRIASIFPSLIFILHLLASRPINFECTRRRARWTFSRAFCVASFEFHVWKCLEGKLSVYFIFMEKLVWVAVRKFDIVSYNFATLFWFFLKIHFAKEFRKFEAFENDFAVKYFMTSQLPLHIDFEDKKVGSRNVTQFSHYNILHCLAYTMPSLRTFTVISFHTCISIDCVWG